MVMRLAATLIVALAMTPLVYGQGKVPVYIIASSADDDDVGRQFVFEIKENIRGSHAFHLVENSAEWPYVKLGIITVRTSAGGTAASISFAYDSRDMPLRGAFITAHVQTCSRQLTVSCARGTLASLDEAVQSLQRDDRALWVTLRK